MPPMERSRPEGIFGGHNCHLPVWYDDVRPPRPRKRVRSHDVIRFGRSKAETGRRPVADERQGPAAPAETKQTRRGRVTRSPRFPAPTPPRQHVHSAERQEEVIPCARGPRKPWIRTTDRLPRGAPCKCRCVRRTLACDGVAWSSCRHGCRRFRRVFRRCCRCFGSRQWVFRVFCTRC